MGANLQHEIGHLAARLEQIEARFGGVQRGVERRRVSKFDPRTPAELARGAMQGGDRMALHGYAAHYARYLLPILKRPGLVVVELGVLRGSGLALLCELFPHARRVIGLDVDSSHYREHRSKLEALGAFRRKQPEVHEFDELAPDAAERFASILAGDKVDVFIHDALHTDGPILATMAHVTRHLRPGFRCFIEDNSTVATKIMQAPWTNCAVESCGRLTIMAADT